MKGLHPVVFSRMRRAWTIAIVIFITLVAVWGWTKVRFDTDPLAVMPSSMQEVEGLRKLQDVVAKKGELVVLLQVDEERAGDLAELSAEIGQKLGDSSMATAVRWEPQWRHDPEGMAELFAWLWLNGSSEELEQLEKSLSTEEIPDTMQSSIERLATALDGAEMMMASHDPFGFLSHSSLQELFASSEMEGEGFESADGTAHLLLVQAPDPLEGYKEYDSWLNGIRSQVNPWAEDNNVTVGFTGDPAFEAEIGGTMEKDMRGTIGITSALIGLLFLLMQRRHSLLLGMAVVLALVIFSTMGIAGLIIGDMSIMAAGFAAILIGLVVDYGVLICQEAKLADHSAQKIRRSVAASIAWAAATTAVVFLALNLSGLPGISQLGSMVAIGVILGAFFMLVIYVNWAARSGEGRQFMDSQPVCVTGQRWPWITYTAVFLMAAGTLAWMGLPGVKFDQGLLRPRNSSAMATFESIEQKFPMWAAPSLRLIVESDSDDQMFASLDRLQADLETMAAEHPDWVKGYQLPSKWWPSVNNANANSQTIRSLGQNKERIIAAADMAGYSEEGTMLGRQVLDAMMTVADKPAGWLPDSPAAQEWLRTIVNREPDGSGYLIGRLDLVNPEEVQVEQLDVIREIADDNVYVAGWSLIRPAVLPLVMEDVYKVLLPMVGLMLIMLSVVFRNVKDVAVSMLAMALSGILLILTMRIFGLEWNFLNIAATPLLLGTGLDYSIHMLLALKRTGGDVRAVWNGTGKAVLFCGVSTAIGFGSLAFAKIDALASLGKVALIGTLISMVVTLVLLPGLRGGVVSDRP